MDINTARIVLWILFIAFALKAQWRFFDPAKHIVKHSESSEIIGQDKFVVVVNIATSLISIAVVFALGGSLIFLNDIFIYLNTLRFG